MAELKELVEFKKEFDRKHGNWTWESSNDKEKLNWLAEGAICLTGEIGEFANLVKKARRRFVSLNELPSNDEYAKMKEEIVDVFIYILKVAGQILDMDLEKEYFEKMKINNGRFKEFER